MPSNQRSSGCTGTYQYAGLRSNLAIKAPLSRRTTLAATSSIVIYVSEHHSLLMPSFTLPPAGDDKSTINRHWPGSDLGTTPNGLTCTCYAVWDQGRTFCCIQSQYSCLLCPCVPWLTSYSPVPVYIEHDGSRNLSGNCCQGERLGVAPKLLPGKGLLSGPTQYLISWLLVGCMTPAATMLLS